MKRLVAGALLSLGTAAVAEEPGWRGGVSIDFGRATADISNVPAKDRGYRSVGGAAVSVGYRVNDRLVLELRPGFGTAGAKVLSAPTVTLKGSSFEVPFLASIDFGTGGTRPYAIGGFGVTFIDSIKAVASSSSQDLKKDFRKSDLTARLGIGVRGSGPVAAFFEADATWGFRNLNLGTGLGANAGSVKNRAFHARAGFSFGRKK